jgi:photosystem II stability/assembly factor-like uncharacterized protein
MRLSFRVAALLCVLPLLLAAAPQREEDRAPGFPDIAQAQAGIFVASGDGTLRKLDGETLPVVLDTGRKLVGLAVSEDGQQLAAVGAGVVARSSDGGRTFRVEPTPDGALVYAAAFSGGELLLFDAKGRGFRHSAEGKGFQPLTLPRTGHFWTASFSGKKGYVVGQGGVLLATQDGGRTWKALTSPDPEPQGVLAMGNAVWVSGQEGVFRSDDAGRTFRQVYDSPPTQPHANCSRMAGRGRAVVVACGPFEQALLYAPDGQRFAVVPVRDAANLLSALITPEGELLAVGAFELFIRATPQKGRIVSHSEHTRRWLDLMAKKRAREEEAKARPATPAQQKPSAPSQPAEPPVPVRDGEARVVAGTVWNERGQPLAGLKLELRASWAVHGEGYQKTTTGPDGTYRFAPTRVDSALVWLEAPGYAPARRTVPVSPSGETVLDFKLQPEVTLAGTVVSAEGPVRKGWVVLWPLPPQGVNMESWRGHTVRVSSADLDAAGAFRLKGVPAGEYLLEAQASGFQPVSQRVRAPDASVRVTLSRGARVTGRLLSQGGEPVGSAEARLSPLPETKRAQAQAGVDVSVSGQTDAQGRFALEGVPEGEYALEVSTGRGMERVCLRRTVRVRGGEADPVELRLGQGPTISGRVTDARGRPAEGLEVLGLAPGDLCGSRIASTGPDGTFTLRDVEAGATYELSVLEGKRPRTGTGAAPPLQVEAGTRNVRIVLPEAP